MLEDGSIVQCVQEAKRAWHAGVSSWVGENDVNSCSIGIEIVNRGHDLGYPDFPLRQIAAVIALCNGIMLAATCPSIASSAHSDVAPGRKKDPGEKFPWLAGEFRRRALGRAGTDRARRDLKLGSQRRRSREHADALASYGYGVPTHGKYDGPTMEVVTAFQRHFRPERVDGVADHSTMSTLHALLASLPEEVDSAVVPAK